MVRKARRYLNKENILFNCGDGAFYGTIIKEEKNYFFVPDYNPKEKIPLTFNGKNRVFFKDGFLEKRIKEL